MSSRRRISTTILFATALLLGNPGQAGERPEWRDWATGDRAGLGVSAFFLNSDAELGLKDELLGLNVSLDPGKLLGLDDNQTVPVYETFWRFAKRHSLRFRHFSQDQSHKDVLELLDFEITTFETEFELTSDTLAYTYSVVFDPNRDFYLGVGIDQVSVKIELRDTEELIKPQKVDGDAPIPSFMVGYDWAFSERWVWLNTANILAVSLALEDDVDLEGDIWGLRSQVEWRVARYASLTAGLEYNRWDVSARTKREQLRVTYKDEYWGPRVGLIVRF